MATRDLQSLDRRAARAIVAVDERPKSQLAMIAAIDDLRAACPKGGVLAREIGRLRQERTTAIRAFHLSRVESAAHRSALSGAREEFIRVLREAIFVLEALDDDKDAGMLRTLRLRLDDAQRGPRGTPRPFFARYLEHQAR